MFLNKTAVQFCTGMFKVFTSVHTMYYQNIKHAPAGDASMF